jgi:hypothetical protein
MPSMAKPLDVADKAALRRVCSELSGNPEFIASLEPLWRSVVPSEAPADVLGCSDDVWSWIAICRRPRSSCFLEDIEKIASATGVDAAKLQGFIVTALTAERFQNAPPEPAEDPTELLAARRYDEDEQ